MPVATFVVIFRYFSKLSILVAHTPFLVAGFRLAVLCQMYRTWCWAVPDAFGVPVRRMAPDFNMQLALYILPQHLSITIIIVKAS